MQDMNASELNAAMQHLTQGIAQEVLEQTEAAHPLPRPTSLNDAPRPAQATPAQAAPQTAPSTGRPDESRRFAGKYVSVEELEKGHLHAQSLITRLQAENAQLRAVPTTAAPAPVTAPRVNPVTREVIMSEKLKQFGERNQIPAQELAEVVSEIARGVVAEENAPAQAQAQTVAYMRANHPRFFDFQNEVLAHVSANPQLSAEVSREMNQGNYTGAAVLAWSDYALSAGVDVHQRMVANNTVLNQEVEKARVDAGLVPTQASGVHEAGPDPRFITAEKLNELYELSRNGYPMPLARELIGNTLPDDIFGINQ